MENSAIISIYDMVMGRRAQEKAKEGGGAASSGQPTARQKKTKPKPGKAKIKDKEKVEAEPMMPESQRNQRTSVTASHMTKTKGPLMPTMPLQPFKKEALSQLVEKMSAKMRSISHKRANRSSLTIKISDALYEQPSAKAPRKKSSAVRLSKKSSSSSIKSKPHATLSSTRIKRRPKTPKRAERESENGKLKSKQLRLLARKSKVSLQLPQAQAKNAQLTRRSEAAADVARWRV